MRLRIVKPIKDIEPTYIRVLKETESHQYQFFGKNGFLGRSPCRSSIKKLTPEAAINRAMICTDSCWDTCNLVDGKGNVLDSITRSKALKRYTVRIYREIETYSKDLPELRGVIC
jgi:hypothetical protein